MPNPTCTINTASTPYQATYAEELIIELADPTGVNAWNLSAIGTDEGQVAATETANLVYDFIKKRYTYTFPGSASSLIFRSEINNGKDTSGSYDSSLTTTFIVSASTLLGYNLIAQGETNEHGEFGWSSEINSKIEAGIETAEINVSLIVNDTITVSTTLTVEENTIHSALWLKADTFSTAPVYLDDEVVCFFDTISNTIHMPPPVIGRKIILIDTSNTITHYAVPNSGEDINHGSSLIILPGNSRSLISDGTDWYLG